MTTGAARVVDAPLTAVAKGYRQTEAVRHKLFPRVPVIARGGKIIAFNADDFNKYDTQRAPGANRARAEFGYGSENYAIVQRALDAVVPREQVEEAAAVPGIDLQMVHVNKAMSIIEMQVEREAATLATTAANYSNSHHLALAQNKRWDQANTKPNKEVETARQKIRQGIGMKPNLLVLGPDVFGALCRHDDVLNAIRPTEGLKEDGAPTVNEAKLASYFDVDEVVVGYAMTGKPGDFEDAWGKNAILAFTRPESLANMGTPAFGYSYNLTGYPIVEAGWFDKNVDSWVYPVTAEETPVISAKDAGFLFSTVVD